MGNEVIIERKVFRSGDFLNENGEEIDTETSDLILSVEDPLLRKTCIGYVRGKSWEDRRHEGFLIVIREAYVVLKEAIKGLPVYTMIEYLWDWAKKIRSSNSELRGLIEHACNELFGIAIRVYAAEKELAATA